MDSDRYLAADFGQFPGVFSPGIISDKTSFPDGSTRTTFAVDKALAWGALGITAYAVAFRPQLVKEALRAVASTPAAPWLLAGGALVAWLAYSNGKKPALPR